MRPIFLPIYQKQFLIIFLLLLLRWSGLDWTQVLEENRRQGEEDQAFEKRVEGKKAAAKKRATRRSACFYFLFFTIYHWEEKEEG
jgi:hypothetical protein